MMKHIRYFQYVCKHKWYVFLACLQYGLIWRGIIHDWTKFLPIEWFAYVNHFFGEKRPDMGAQGYSHQTRPDDTAFNYAWNHHQKANAHHWQFYIMNYDSGQTLLLEMPDADRKEMVADWRGAGLAQGKPDTWAWYQANKEKIQLHPNTRAWVETELAASKTRT